MERQPDKNSWVLVKSEVFDDEQEIKKGAIGRFVKRDGFLIVIDFFGKRLVLKPSHVIFLCNGVNLTMDESMKNLVRALDQFDQIQKGDPPHLHLPICESLIRSAQRSINGCHRAVEELDMAIENLPYCCDDKQVEYFPQHIGRAMLLMLGFL